jgi:methylmalonyl-CoA/ethylmalonyl-CoA epimerase
MSVPDSDLTRIGQIGFVVRDLQSAMEWYWRTLGIGPWKVYTNSAPPLQYFYRGQPATYKAKVALAQSGPLVIELIQYLEGDSIHQEFLDSGREGIEHVGIYVQNLAEALAPLAEKGVTVLQSGKGIGVSGDGGYAFLDTESSAGVLVELVQTPSERVSPERVYP